MRSDRWVLIWFPRFTVDFHNFIYPFFSWMFVAEKNEIAGTLDTCRLESMLLGVSAKRSLPYGNWSQVRALVERTRCYPSLQCSWWCSGAFVSTNGVTGLCPCGPLCQPGDHGDPKLCGGDGQAGQCCWEGGRRAFWINKDWRRKVRGVILFLFFSGEVEQEYMEAFAAFFKQLQQECQIQLLQVATKRWFGNTRFFFGETLEITRMFGRISSRRWWERWDLIGFPWICGICPSLDSLCIWGQWVGLSLAGGDRWGDGVFEFRVWLLGIDCNML